MSRSAATQEQIGHGAVEGCGNGDDFPRTDVDDVVGWGDASITKWVTGHPKEFKVDTKAKQVRGSAIKRTPSDGGWGGRQDK